MPLARGSIRLERVRAKQKAVRDQILRTAADLFRERGFPATTLDDVARPLGMSKASLYTYFRGKDEILAAISQETIERFTRELSLVLGSDLSPEDKLRRIVREHVRFVIANRSFLTVFFSEEANLPARFARALAAQKDRYDKGVESVIADGIRRGVFRDVPPRLVVFGLLGMVNWLYKWYNPRGPWGAEEISSAFLAMVEDGLLRRQRREPSVTRRIARVRRDLSDLAKALEA